ncbi:solute carrier family 22 member 7 isoform X2 [Monodelphis domestica]|uniref:solute carrier family 22 member 7 isoform X2 n=1 Tax=Monodelphis domestica TaxID=13616 RepID=UPI0024E215CB|nr:solute carrier family 22 member 7 isoform X2 [Monodelphis domestica]
MGFEELLKEVGGYGRFQIRNVLLLVLPRLLLPLNFLLPIFIAAVPSHHCALPAQDPLDNLTQESAWLEAYVPREQDGSLSSCYRYLHPHHSNTTPEEQEDQVVPCPDGWSYDQSQFYSTIATQWDLVCERKGLNRVISTFFFIGVLVGAVIFGYLSDRFGRRPLLLVAYVSSLVLGLVSVISVSYIMFVITRTLTGVALAGFTIIVLPLELEWLDVGHRTMAGILASAFWSMGVMLLALIGYLIRDWRWLLLAVTLPCVPGILSLWWVPESARWLMTQGRVKEAQHYLLQCAALNGRPQARDRLSTEALSLVAEGEKMVRRPSYLDLFRTPRLRHISLCCMVVWFGVNFSYYGLSLDLSGLGLNLYQIQLLFGVVEIPSKMIVYLSVRYAGRRLTEVGALLGTALTVGASLLLPSALLPGQSSPWHSSPPRVGHMEISPGSSWKRLFRSSLYHCLPVYIRVVPHCTEADRVGTDRPGGPAGGLPCTTGHLAGRDMEPTTQGHLWWDCPCGLSYCSPAARDSPCRAS